jgi:hypothetical protein
MGQRPFASIAVRANALSANFFEFMVVFLEGQPLDEAAFRSESFCAALCAATI